MRTRAIRKATRQYFWDRIRASLWFVPLVMAVSAVLLSWLLGMLDDIIPNRMFMGSKFIITGSASDMRAAMISIAATVLGTAGVVFSLLTLPLSTVASQFGSRLLRVFLRDRTTQYVLGMFVATFCYCLATALSIPNVPNQFAGPQITVTFGLFMMVLTFGSLIILIQHISTMLQAPNIVAAAGSDLLEAVRMETMEGVGESSSSVFEQVNNSLVENEAYPLRVKAMGYIQFYDPQIILNLANANDLIIRLLRKPGQFIRLGDVVALIWPADKVDERLAKSLRHGVQIGKQRTPTQDVEYAINQLVEIAVRAMSPAINDPFTALTCLDYLADGLAKYTRSDASSINYYGQDGKLRLVFESATLAELLQAAFDMLRHASCDNANVLLAILDAIDDIGQEAKSQQARLELLRHVRLVQAEAQAGALIESDRERIYLRCKILEAKLATPGESFGSPNPIEPGIH
jgi:uncharacterized membrane protein